MAAPAGHVALAAHLDQLRSVDGPEVDLARLLGSIELHLGGVTVAETALSIAAEIVATDHGGTGLPLSATPATIHAEGE